MWVSLFEPDVADVDTIGYGKFQNSVTFQVMGAKAVPAMGITEHTSGRADMTIPVTNWDGYLRDWDIGNSMLQLVIATFLVSFR